MQTIHFSAPPDDPVLTDAPPFIAPLISEDLLTSPATVLPLAVEATPIPQVQQAYATQTPVAAEYVTIALAVSNDGLDLSQAALPPTATLASYSESDNASPPMGKSNADEAVALLELGDEAMRSRDLSGAIKHYNRAVSLMQGQPPLSMLFRQAVASECLGMISRASEQYEAMRSAAGESVWRDIALLGQMRCWIARGDFEQAIVAAYPRAVLDSRGLTSKVLDDLRQLLGVALTDRILRDPQVNLLDDACLALPPWPAESHEQVDHVESILAEHSPTPPVTGLRLLRQDDSTAEGTHLQAMMLDQPAQALLEAVLRTASLRCQFSRSAATSLRNRRVSIATPSVQLSHLLDAYCSKWGLTWTEHEGTIHCQAAAEISNEELAARHHAAAERMLRSIGSKTLDHALADCNQIGLGVLLARDNRNAEAAAIFEAQTKEGRQGDLRAIAAFNLAKCQLRLGVDDQALSSFQLAADNLGVSREILGAAYLYIMRIQMDHRNWRDGLSPGMRALSILAGQPAEIAAAENLAACYLLSGNPQAANSILMQHRSLEADPVQRDRLAFLSSLARFSSATDSAEYERAAQSLADATSHVQPSTGFGGFWWLLVGRTQLSLGFPESATATYERALTAGAPAPIATQILLELKQLDSQSVDRLDLDDLLAAMPAEQVSDLRLTAKLNLVESTMKEGDYAAAARLCRELLSECRNSDLRRQAMSRLGRCYQAVGDYQSAVQCFSGVVPEASITEITIEPRANSPHEVGRGHTP